MATARNKHHHVHVVRHHAPGMKVVARTMKVLQRAGDRFTTIAQDAGPITPIKFTIEPNGKGPIESRTILGSLEAADQALTFKEQ